MWITVEAIRWGVLVMVRRPGADERDLPSQVSYVDGKEEDFELMMKPAVTRRWQEKWNITVRNAGSVLARRMSS